ncbi:MAG: Fic family protein [Planctomycetota bacterium]
MSEIAPKQRTWVDRLRVILNRSGRSKEAAEDLSSLIYGDDEPPENEAVQLGKLADSLIESAAALHKRVIDPILLPIGRELETLNLELPPKESINLEPFRDPHWRGELAYVVAEALRNDWLTSTPLETFREMILGSSAKTAKWCAQFVDWVATDRKKVAEQIVSQIVQRRFSEPLGNKVESHHRATGERMIAQQTAALEEAKQLKTRIDGLMKSEAEGGAGLEKGKAVEQCSADLKKVLGLNRPPFAGDVRQLESSIRRIEEGLANFAGDGGPVDGYVRAVNAMRVARAQDTARTREEWAVGVARRWQGPGDPPQPFHRTKDVDPDENPSILAGREIHDLRPYKVVAAGDTAGLRQNLHAMFEEPVHATTSARAGALIDRIRKLEGVTRPLTASGQQPSEFDKVRMGGSQTMKDDNVNAQTARRKWVEADGLVFKAATANRPTTPESLLKLMSDINKTLGDEVFEHAGELRSDEDVAAGADTDPNDPGGWTRAYIPGAEVEREMLELARWLSRALERGDNPIEVAALTYQRMVSIHPFHDANGRASRFMMDFVLQKGGLLPASLGDNVMVGQFCRIAPDEQPSTTGAVNVVIEGVQRSYEAVSAIKG